MKFDIVDPGHNEEALVPGARSSEGTHHPAAAAAESSVPSPGLKLQQASEYMRLRAHTDFARVRSSLNQMLHTVEAVQAEADLAAGSDTPDEPGLFRPEAFHSRPRTPTAL